MSCPDQFYENEPESSLRFGDVLTGFQAMVAQTDNPTDKPICDLAIRVSKPAYLVVMTPCCSIEKKSIALAPLAQIRPSFLDNPFLAEDLTRVNRHVPPEKSVSPYVWENKFPAEKKQELKARGSGYICLECFVYKAHSLLKSYRLDRRGGAVEMGDYMVDFKSIYRVDCKLIERGRNAPSGLKLLQLTPYTREDLRDKLGYYFGRVPDEDRAILGS